jgi:hypothetical protein
MKYDIECSKKFYFELNIEQVKLIMELSASHYDQVCRGLSLAPDWNKRQDPTHGTVYHWQNQLNLVGKPDIVSATWRDLDTISKALEGSNYLRDDDKYRMALQLSRDFHMMLTQANRLDWKASLDTSTH